MRVDKTVFQKYQKYNIVLANYLKIALRQLWQYRTEQRPGRIIFYFSLLTILVSCLGLFGLAMFTAEQRTKEIGIREPGEEFAQRVTVAV